MRKVCRHILVLKQDHASHQLLYEPVFGIDLPSLQYMCYDHPLAILHCLFLRWDPLHRKLHGNTGSVIFLRVQGTIRAAITTAYMFPAFTVLCPVAQPEISLKTGNKYWCKMTCCILAMWNLNLKLPILWRNLIFYTVQSLLIVGVFLVDNSLLVF